MTENPKYKYEYTGEVRLQFSTAESSLANWASSLIRRLSHSPFSHVDFVLPDGNLLGASDQGKNSPCIDGNPCGVAIRPPNYQGFGLCRTMVIRTDKDTEIYRAALSQLGKPFDASGLLTFLDEKAFDRPWRDPDMWWCSELGVWSFETGGYWQPKKLIWPKSRVSPTDFWVMFMWDDNFVNRDTFWEGTGHAAMFDR